MICSTYLQLATSFRFVFPAQLFLGLQVSDAVASRLPSSRVLLSLVRPFLSAMDLNNLNKSSAKVAAFRVSMAMGNLVEYTYQSKKNSSTVKAQKFEVYVVGQNAEAYCIGYVKGTMEDCRKAQEKFCDGSAWTLSRVAFDTWTNASYISTPVPYRIDLAKSSLVAVEGSSSSVPRVPVPPRTVADIARIKTNKGSDLLAVVKEVKRERTNKNEQTIADVTLIDDSELKKGRLATAVVNVWGKEKVELLKQHVGEPMMFFNLSIVVSNGNAVVNHFAADVVKQPPVCSKTEALRNRRTELADATNTELLTHAWTPSQGKDVSGSQPLSCSAFLDYSRSTPDANVPEVVQLMWLHIEEPEVTADVLHKDRIWYKICARDMSGGIQVGIPQRNALSLASCSTMEDFVRKHQGNELNMPLLCHARVSRSIRPVSEDRSTHYMSRGASDLTQGEYSSSKRSLTSESFRSGYVNYTVEEVEPVSWDLASKPNASYNQVLDVLNHCPPHSEGIAFVFLADVEPDPHYGFRIMYDDLEGMKCTYFAALIGCDTKSATEQFGIGFKVVTSKVKDIANPISIVSRHADAETTTGAASQRADSSYTIVGYRTLDDLLGFCWILLEAEPCAALLCSLPRKTRKASTSISWSTLNQTRSIMPSYACRNCGCSAKRSSQIH